MAVCVEAARRPPEDVRRAELSFASRHVQHDLGGVAAVDEAVVCTSVEGEPEPLHASPQAARVGLVAPAVLDLQVDPRRKAAAKASLDPAASGQQRERGEAGITQRSVD